MNGQVAAAHELLQVVQEVCREQDGACAADDQPEEVVLYEAAKQDAQHQHKPAGPQEAACTNSTVVMEVQIHSASSQVALPLPKSQNRQLLILLPIPELLWTESTKEMQCILLYDELQSQGYVKA